MVPKVYPSSSSRLNEHDQPPCFLLPRLSDLILAPEHCVSSHLHTSHRLLLLPACPSLLKAPPRSDLSSNVSSLEKTTISPLHPFYSVYSLILKFYLYSTLIPFVIKYLSDYQINVFLPDLYCEFHRAPVKSVLLTFISPEFDQHLKDTQYRFCLLGSWLDKQTIKWTKKQMNSYQKNIFKWPVSHLGFELKIILKMFLWKNSIESKVLNQISHYLV